MVFLFFCHGYLRAVLCRGGDDGDKVVVSRVVEEDHRRSSRGSKYTLTQFRNFYGGGAPVLWDLGRDSLLNTIVDPLWALEVAVAPDDKGKGVFATIGMKKGTYVLSMGKTTRGRPRCGPHDSIIHGIDGVTYYDAVFVEAFCAGTVDEHAPWYRLNHCPRGGNLAMVWIGDTVAWRARRDILEGEELLFRYSDDDEANKDLDGCRCPLCTEQLLDEFFYGAPDSGEEVRKGRALLGIED